VWSQLTHSNFLLVIWMDVFLFFWKSKEINSSDSG
jgi:hypothetical protein